MTRFMNRAGTGLQLWDVARFYVELYADWPASPSEIWTSQVIRYTLPRTRLGGCGEGELTVVTEPGRLPAGFEAVDVPGQPVRCLDLSFQRLALVIAVLPNGDEWVIYAGAVGKVQATAPRQWSVPLIGLDALWMQEFADRSNIGSWTRDASGWHWGAIVNRLPTPAGLKPIAAVSRLYGPSGPIAASSTELMAPPDQVSPLTTLEQWWKMALQPYPNGEFGVGPDMVFVAGVPQGTSATQAVYALDSRGYGLTSAGREVTPYISRARGHIDGAGEQNRTGASLSSMPRFAPRRTATYGGSTTTTTHSETGALQVTGGGQIEITGPGMDNRTVTGSLTAVTGIMQAVDLTAHLNIWGLEGNVAVNLTAQAHSTSGGFSEIYADRRLALEGTFQIKVSATAEQLAGCDYITFTAGLQGLGSSAKGYASLAGGGSYRYEWNEMQVTWDNPPPGLDYPVLTEEAWTFKLPGVHAGPLLVQGLPSGGNQYATTVINVDGPHLWTDVRCGPLPYQQSPVGLGGRWLG